VPPAARSFSRRVLGLFFVTPNDSAAGLEPGFQSAEVRGLAGGPKCLNSSSYGGDSTPSPLQDGEQQQ
jgi:hypothetical protein